MDGKSFIDTLLIEYFAANIIFYSKPIINIVAKMRMEIYRYIYNEVNVVKW